MIIKFTNYTDGVHELDFDEPVKNVGLEKPYKGNVKALLEMDKSHSQIVLKCYVKAVADFECDRCGETYESVISNNFQLTYLIGREEEKTETVNLYYIMPETDKIEIKSDVKEYIVLAEPMKKLCRDDCKGLCYKCGTNLNYKTCDCKEEVKENAFQSLLKQLKKEN